jgi:hypothetical protein
MYQDRYGIVRLVEHPLFGVFERYIDGLNIFLYNDVDVPTQDDPRVIFLQNLTRQFPSSAHVGSLALKDMVDDPLELFGPPDGRTPYTRTRISYYNCDFYDLNEYPCFDACFFPEVTNKFWEAKAADGTDIGGLFDWHGLAVYIGAKAGALEEMSQLLAAPFPGQGQWLQAVTRLYSIVITVGHDGQNFQAYAQELESYNLLQPALDQAAGIVSSSEWFQQNVERLKWEEELSLCLIAEDGRT